MFIYYTRYYNGMLNVKLWRPRYQWFLHHHSPRYQTVPWVRCDCPKASQIFFMKRGECCKDVLNVFQVQAAFRTRTGSCGYHFIFVHKIQQSTKRQWGSLWMPYMFAVYISGVHLYNLHTSIWLTTHANKMLVEDCPLSPALGHP